MAFSKMAEGNGFVVESPEMVLRNTRRTISSGLICNDKDMKPNEKGGNLNRRTAIRQKRAQLVAEFAFKQRLERIAWEDEVMTPELQRLEMEMTETLEIPQFLFEEEDETKGS